MINEEIDIIRLALDTEIDHKCYAEHNLAAKIILNEHEQKNKGQLLPKHLVICCSHPYDDVEQDDSGRMVCKCGTILSQ